MIEYMYAEGVLEFLSERPQLARALRAKPIEVCWRLLPAAEAAAVDGEEERAQGDQGRISVMHGLGEDSDGSGGGDHPLLVSPLLLNGAQISEMLPRGPSPPSRGAAAAAGGPGSGIGEAAGGELPEDDEVEQWHVRTFEPYILLVHIYRLPQHDNAPVPPATGACGHNRPCAQQYVGKSQSCMISNGRLIPHASYRPAPS